MIALTANTFTFDQDFGDLRNSMGGSAECPLDSANPQVKSIGRNAVVTGVTCVECTESKTHLNFDITNWDWSMDD